MESKLNLIAIQEYSEELARIFIEETDKSKTLYSGKDLLNFNEIKQVNLFILKDIFFGWQEQSENLKSPYFNFDNAEVKEAMGKLMNLLSHHIEIRKEDFYQLCSNAINDTILFYLVPDYYLTQFIRELDESRLIKETFQKLKSYIDLNSGLYTDFLNRINELNDPLNPDELLKILGNISFEAEEKDIFDYFSSKKNLDIEQFLNIQEQETAVPKVEKPADELGGGKRFEFDNERIVHEKFKKDEPTVNDKLMDKKSPALVDDLRKSKINSISKSISLNQRFIFIKELFQGNLETYEKALISLDGFESWEEANQFIEESIAPDNNWDISRDSVAEFTGIVERRYR